MTVRPRVVHMCVAPEFVDRIMLLDLRRLRRTEDITIVSAEGAALARARREGFRVHVVNARRKISPVADLRTLWQLWRFFRTERFDLLHTYTPKAGLLGQLAGLLAGVPRRLHACRGLLYGPSLRGWRHALVRTTDRLTARLAHATLFVSGADRDFAVSQGLCAPERAICTGSGVELDAFAGAAPSDEERAALRDRLGIGPDETLVLSIGRYVADKGYEEIAGAAAALRPQHPGLRYVWIAPVLVGEDGVLPATLPAQHGVADLVRLEGFTDDVRPVMRAADLLLHASRREGVPRVLLESAAIGLPIVASDIPGCREIVDGQTAYLFQAGDAAALAAAMRRALADPAERRARAGRARTSVRARFDQDMLSERIRAVHDALLREGPGAVRALPRG